MPEKLEKSNYLGSKRRLAKYIVDRFPDGVKTLSDPMCGVSAVLIEAARRGMRIKGNDLSIIPYWYSKGVFEGTPLSEADVEKLLSAPPRSGWLVAEWQGIYPRPPAVRRYLDGLAKLARGWSGPKGLTAKAAVSATLQTLYSESGSGYSTRRYEDVEKVRAVVRRAAKEVSKLAEEVGGKGTITNVDAKSFSFPRADAVYFDPPYFKRDKGAIHYFQSYRIMNSVLLGREWKEKNLSPDDIPAILQKLCRSARHVFVSTSSNEVVPYAKEIARHKKTMKRFRLSYRQTSGFGGRDVEQHQNLYVAKAESQTDKEKDHPALPVDFEYAVEIAKAYDDKEGQWIVEGYAATSDFDLQEDIITEEAIRTSAKDLIESSTVLHNHNTDEAIGRVLTSRARKDGLFLKILVSKTAPTIWQQIKEGVLNKFSVRGKVLEARKQWIPELKRHARVILKMRLLEVSLVAVPANPKARAIGWYVEKALDEFEKAGGEIQPVNGGPEMAVKPEDGDADVEIAVELIEAKGEAGNAGDGAGSAPKPDVLAGNAAEADTKQVSPGALAMVERLLASESDPERKKLIEQLLQAMKQPAPVAKADEGEVEKAGRKLSSARLARLKKLLKELEGLIGEVDIASSADRKDVKKAEASEASPDKLAEIEGAVGKIAKALGIAGDKEAGEVPNIADAVKDIGKRLEDLENTPGSKTSLDEGDEEDEGGKKDKGSVFKGLL
jgi:HK97 family phage prohead protease